MQNVGSSSYSGAFESQALKAAGRDLAAERDDGDLGESNQDGESTNPTPDNDYARRAYVVRHEPQGATLDGNED